MKFYIHEMHFNTGKLLQYNRKQNDLLFACYTSVYILFSNFASRHLRDFGDTRPIVSERAKTTPSHYGIWCWSLLALEWTPIFTS